MRRPATQLTGRSLSRTAVLVAAFAAFLVTAAPAAAASSCGRAVLDDWSDGRIDKQYPLHCYDDAIELLPRDLADYSSAEEDMRRALQAARRGEDAPPNRGNDPPPEQPEEPSTTVGGPGEEPAETTAAPPTAGPGPDDPDGENEVAPAIDTESASAVPIPLLILAGLALLLVAGGSAGYLIRRVQGRRVPRTNA